jgi:uncharacterized membrane protein (UPF0127 family)
MKKILILFVILLIVVGGIYVVQGYLKGEKISIFKTTPTATIAGQIFRLTTAISDQERQIGLSKTKSLSSNQGMIFMFQNPGYYSFWMKNMQFPIDIIYIKTDTIVTIIKNAQAPKSNNEGLTIYTPTQPSDKVLEIQAGLSEKYNFKSGDKITFQNL